MPKRSIKLLNDSEFIIGSIVEKYPVPSLSADIYSKLDTKTRNIVQEHQIEVTRKDTGESRKFSVIEYASLKVDNFLVEVDNTTVYNEKMLILNNAKHSINRLVEFITPSAEEYDFDSIYKKLGDIVEYIKTHNNYGGSNIETANRRGNTNGLTIPEIALLFVYEDKQILYSEAQGIAKKYRGIISATTGKQLYDEYNRYSVKDNRVNTNDNKRSASNMKKRIENILPHIKKEDGKKKAEAELSILKNK